MTSVSKPVRSRAGVWIRLAVALVAAMVATLAGHGTAAFATPSSAATTADVSSAKRSAASYDGTPSHVIASQAARTRTDERTTLQLSRIVIIGLRAAASGAVVAAKTAPETLSFGSRAAAREGLPGDLAAAGNRFFRGATSKSHDFEAIGLPGGGYRLQFFSPANNPGYGKLYVQEIDRTGQVLREYKNTMGPDGLIETKWVHGGP